METGEERFGELQASVPLLVKEAEAVSALAVVTEVTSSPLCCVAANDTALSWSGCVSLSVKDSPVVWSACCVNKV